MDHLPPLFEQHLERDREGLRRRVRKMAQMVLTQFEDAVTAFTEDNPSLAYMVVLRDPRVNLMEDHIDRLAQEFLVRHMPVSEHLRFAVAVARVNAGLERIGDYAKAIARRAVALSGVGEIPYRDQIREMAKIAHQMLAHAVDSFLDLNADLALATLESDQLVDQMESTVCESLSHVEEGPKDLHARFTLLDVVNRVERVADRACNIAEEAVYVVRGQMLRHVPRKDMRVLFLCAHNASTSQLAEGIARRLAPQHFIFSSAGWAPRPIDPRAVAFAAQQGVDLSRQRSKPIENLGRLEDFDIVITLADDSAEPRPKIPRRVVQFTWNVRDPAAASGTPEETEAAWRQAFQELEQRIRDLANALAGVFAPEDDE